MPTSNLHFLFEAATNSSNNHLESCNDTINFKSSMVQTAINIMAGHSLLGQFTVFTGSFKSMATHLPYSSGESKALTEFITRMLNLTDSALIPISEGLNEALKSEHALQILQKIANFLRNQHVGCLALVGNKRSLQKFVQHWLTLMPNTQCTLHKVKRGLNIMVINLPNMLDKSNSNIEKAEQMGSDNDENSSELFELLHYYSGIKNEETRKQVLDMAKSLEEPSLEE